MNHIKRKILFLTFIYIFASITFLTPFISIDGASKALGFIIIGVLTFIYLFILIKMIYDYRRNK